MADEMKTLVRKTDDVTEVGVAGVGTPQATRVIAVSTVLLVLVRVCRVFVQSMLGLLGADAAGAVQLAPDGTFWLHVKAAAAASLCVAFVSLLQNISEVLTKLDVKFPQLRG